MDALGLEWLGQFAVGLELLDDYDHEQLDGKGLSNRQAVYPADSDYQGLIDAIAQISKGFGEEDFYPSIEVLPVITEIINVSKLIPHFTKNSIECYQAGIPDWIFVGKMIIRNTNPIGTF